METAFKSIRDVEIYLNSIPKFSQSGSRATNFNLGRMVRFCAEIGNPHENLAAVHVAGTNGKGTTCQMLASVYQTAGYKTALYTSPHLLTLSERFKINGKEIDPEYLLAFFKKWGNLVQKYELTFFELTTVIAFWYFLSENVDIAIIETGLGGKFDATNILKPLVSVITSVGLDHTDLLGDTLEQIAGEKAGIIKPGIPVVAGRLPGGAKSVILDAAEKNGSELIFAENCEPLYENGSIKIKTDSETINIYVPDRKKIDSVNAAVSYNVSKVLHHVFPVALSEFIKGIEETTHRFPNHAHFEKLSRDRNWYFDGAHNSEAMKILTDELLEKAPAEEWIVVLSFMKDKLNPELTRIWKKFPDLRLYEMEGERAATFEEMARYLPQATQVRENDFLNPNERIKSELVIFSGSFYFYAKVRRWMGTIATYDD